MRALGTLIPPSFSVALPSPHLELSEHEETRLSGPSHWSPGHVNDKGTSASEISAHFPHTGTGETFTSFSRIFPPPRQYFQL